MKEQRKLMKKRMKVMKKHFKKPFKKKYKVEAVEFIENDLLVLEERAVNILTAEDQKLSEPIIIVQANTNEEDLKYRLVKMDDKTLINYNKSTVLTFLFGEKSFFYHEADINHLNGLVSSDFTGEINYKDIVNVETYFKNENVGKTDISRIELVLGLVNGDSLNLDLRKHYYFDTKEQIPVLKDDEKYVIDQIRKAIRTVK